VAPNLLNQNFNPVRKDEVWAGEVTYLRAAEGWMYLSILMDLYSRRIVGWHIDKRMMSAYMRYYNQERFHSSNGDMSPVKFEISQIKVP
jgi:putative transposase